MCVKCSSRRAQHTQETHNLDTGTTTRTQQSVYSNFDTEHNIEKLYLASRNNTNNNAHQNLACTFDLSDKICTVCTTPHNILSQTQQSPLTFVISDQGFLGILSGGGTRFASKLSGSKTARRRSCPTCSWKCFRV